MALWEYNGAGSGTTQGLYHLNGNANDSSWNANNGTATNVTWVWGKIGSGAGRFNGSSSKIVCAAPVMAKWATTISFWFNSSRTSAFQSVLWNSSWERNSNGKSIFTNTSTGIWFFQLRDSASGSPKFEVSIGAICTWVWKLVTCTWDWTTNAWWVATYVNGALVNTGTSTQTENNTPSKNLWFWANQETWAEYWLSGILDEVIIENRAWTASEIRKYYTYSKGRFWIT